MKRLAAWATGLPPRMQDLTLALVLAAFNVGSLIPETGRLHHAFWGYVLVVLQVLPLIWRRSWPIPVYIAVGIPRNLYDLLAIGYAPVPLGPAIAYFTVMERSSAKWRWAATVGTAIGVTWSQTLPGHNEPYDFFVAVMELAVAGMAGVLSRTHRAYVREVEGRAEQAEAERDRQVALAAAQERTRIARELHDVVAHHVSLMAVQSEAAASLLPGKPVEAGQSVEIIGQTAREALTELRRLLGVLRGPPSPAASGGLTAPSPSISELDEALVPVRQAGITVDLRVQGRPSKLAPGVDLAAYRIVQEALTNTVRHSGAGEAAVTVSYEPGYVTVSVTDTGNGPAAARRRDEPPARPAPPNGKQPHPAGSGGFGLAGIAERVASCGGSLTLGPGTAGGFAVTAKLPTP